MFFFECPSLWRGVVRRQKSCKPNASDFTNDCRKSRIGLHLATFALSLWATHRHIYTSTHTHTHTHNTHRLHPSYTHTIGVDSIILGVCLCKQFPKINAHFARTGDGWKDGWNNSPSLNASAFWPTKKKSKSVCLNNWFLAKSRHRLEHNGYALLLRNQTVLFGGI